MSNTIISAKDVEKALKGYYGVPNHNTQLVVVKKQENSEKDRLIKKSIKDDYKRTFSHLLIVRDDQINETTFLRNLRGRSIEAVELRTMLSVEKYQILAKCVMPTLSHANENYLVNAVGKQL